MGARKFVLPRIRHLVPYKIPWAHQPPTIASRRGLPGAPIEQARIVRTALTGRCYPAAAAGHVGPCRARARCASWR